MRPRHSRRLTSKRVTLTSSRRNYGGTNGGRRAELVSCLEPSSLCFFRRFSTNRGLAPISPSVNDKLTAHSRLYFLSSLSDCGRRSSLILTISSLVGSYPNGSILRSCLQDSCGSRIYWVPPSATSGEHPTNRPQRRIKLEIRESKGLSFCGLLWGSYSLLVLAEDYVFFLRFLGGLYLSIGRSFQVWPHRWRESSLNKSPGGNISLPSEGKNLRRVALYLTKMQALSIIQQKKKHNLLHCDVRYN